MTGPGAQHPTAAPAAETDGRRRRSQDSRARIVQAMLDLVQAGSVSPAAEQVAERAGVGLRTVFRHFRDMESLYREMSAVIEAELMTVVGQPFQAADPRGRVLELIERRATVYEKIAPYRRAGEVQRPRSPVLQDDLARFNTVARDILRRVAPADIVADRHRFEILDMLLSFEAWRRLRMDQGLSPDEVLATLAFAVARILD